MITIIGAGPIGTYTALKLAKYNEIIIYEKKKVSGTPIQCTGILTDSIKEHIKLKKEVIANKINTTRIYAPNNKYAEINFKKPNIIVHRDLFDQQIANEAEDKGVIIKYNLEYRDSKIYDRDNNKYSKLDSKYLIGADGPNSMVAKENGFIKNEFLQGAQAVIKIKNENIVDFYPHIGTYAWAVPEDEQHLRVGVAATKNAKRILDLVLKKYKGKIKEIQGGIIPLYNPQRQIQKNNVLLIGDAAAQIKNTTGGGIIPSMRAADTLAEAIKNKQDYQKSVKKKIGRELWIHYKARQVADKFKDKDWNEIIAIANDEKIKNILAKRNRDNITKIVSEAIIRKPSLLLFARKLI